MRAQELLAELSSAGVRVAAAGDRLIVRPASKLTDELRVRIREHKPEVLEALGNERKAASVDGYYQPDSGRTPVRLATAAERDELANLIIAIGEPIEHRAEALRLALLDPDAALECFRRIAPPRNEH